MLFGLLVIASSAMAQQGTISGQVTDVTGAPLLASLTLRSADSPREFRSLEDGKFVFESVLPGRYALIVRAPGFYPKVLNLRMATGERRVLGRVRLEVMELDFSDSPPTIKFLTNNWTTGNLVTRILTDVANPVSGARVALRCPTSSSCGVRLADAEGRVRFDQLREARYRLVISAPGFYDREVVLDVPGGVEFEYRGIYLEKCQEPTCDPRKRIQGVML